MVATDHAGRHIGFGQLVAGQANLRLRQEVLLHAPRQQQVALGDAALGLATAFGFEQAGDDAGDGLGEGAVERVPGVGPLRLGDEHAEALPGQNDRRGQDAGRSCGDAERLDRGMATGKPVEMAQAGLGQSGLGPGLVVAAALAPGIRDQGRAAGPVDEQSDPRAAIESIQHGVEDLPDQQGGVFAAGRQGGDPGHQFEAVEHLVERALSVACGFLELGGAELDFDFANDQFDPALDHQFAANRMAPMQDTVGAAEVVDAPDAVDPALDLGVASRNGRIVDADVGIGAAPDDHGIGETELLARQRAAGDGQARHDARSVAWRTPMRSIRAASGPDPGHEKTGRRAVRFRVFHEGLRALRVTGPFACRGITCPKQPS